MQHPAKRLAFLGLASVVLVSTIGLPAAFGVHPEGASDGLPERAPATSAGGASALAKTKAPHLAGGHAAAGPSSATTAQVATVHGLTEDRLRRRLRADKSLRIGRGRLMYQEATIAELGVVAGEAAVEPAVMSALTVPPTADAFNLHSNPGSKRVLFLDFDGHDLSGTAWNASYFGGADFSAPAWDIEGGASVFTETERARIVEAWIRVAEDYSGFDLDVTTQDPGAAAITRSSSSDEYFGMRVLISPLSSYVGSYGGIAYVGVFDAVGDYYKPALVFPEKLANNAKYIAEASAHETGHTLGLYHDGVTGGAAYYAGHGTGDTSWAPIMGNGYYSNITQWSRGEYPSANNLEDDLSVMQTNGVAYRSDDMGGTSADAYAIVGGATFAVDGRLERNSDVDVVRFASGGGAFAAFIDHVSSGPNVDLVAELRDSSGGLVASSGPDDLLTSSISASLTPGTYFLSVRGTGKGDPLNGGYSAYGCIGQYSITATGDGGGQLPPTAVGSATPASGVAPLSVQFSSSLSSDPDGQIVAWNWSFGDGTTSTAANPSHVYAAPGSYEATLTVTDNDGLNGTTSTSVAVSSANVAPVARITSTPASGTAPLTVQLSGSGSTDSDDAIASYRWNFGDGTIATARDVSHTYSAGIYTVVLIVTDSRGATGTSSAIITVQSAPAQVMRVASVQLVLIRSSGGNQGRATVRVTTPQGLPVTGVSVSGSWSGTTSGASSGTTDSKGNAVLWSKRFMIGGLLTFSVTNLSKPRYTYDPKQNIVTSASVTAVKLR